MRTPSAQLVIVLTVCCRATGLQYEGYTVFDVFPTEKQKHIFKPLPVLPGYDFWRNSRTDQLTVMVSPVRKTDFLHYLHENGIEYRVSSVDVARNLPMPRQGKNYLPADIFSVYLTHKQMNIYLDLLAKKYPALVTVQDFGYSYQGRKLGMVKISTKTRGVKKPAILIDAGIHAREWIAPAMALFIINQLVENEANRYLTEDLEWHINPLLNPDGYEYSHKTDKWWRKTRSPAFNPKCSGVDANRNFDFHWIECGASRDPCSSVYAGKEAFSENETRALKAYVMSIKNQLKLYLTFHSFGPYILYPWGYTGSRPNNADQLQAIARRANEAQMKAGGPNYIIGSSGSTLYCAAGGSDDWVMGIANISLAYTVEMPPGGETLFHPPPKDIWKLVVPFFEAVRSFAHHVAEYPFNHGSGSYKRFYNGSASNTERKSLMDINYLHTMCLVVIELII